MATALVFKELVHEIEQKTGLENLLSEDEKFCSIEFDEKLIVDIGYNETQDALLLFSLLGEIDPTQAADLHTEMLKANYLFIGTGGPTLGIEGGSGRAALNYQHALENVTVEKLTDLVEGFVHTAMIWMDKIKDVDDGCEDHRDVELPPTEGIKA